MPKPVWPGDLLATDQADAASVQSRTKPLFNALNPSMLADNGDPDGGVDDTMVSDGAIGKEKINQTAAVLTQGGLNTANFQQIKGPFSVGGTVNKGMLLFATALEIPDGSAFPDVSGGNVFITNNTASTSILGFTGGEAELLSPDQTAFGTGQMIFLKAGDANTTITHNDITGGGLNLQTRISLKNGGALSPYPLSQDHFTMFVFRYEFGWAEIGSMGG